MGKNRIIKTEIIPLRLAGQEFSRPVSFYLVAFLIILGINGDQQHR